MTESVVNPAARALRILCISFSPLTTDARVLRQLSILAEFGEVTTIGYGPKPGPATHHLEVPAGASSLPQTPMGVLRLALRRHKAVELTSPGERAALRLLSDASEFDLVVANDARALPLAFAVSGRAAVWGDLHEWAREENTASLPWRLLVAPYMHALCRRYLKRLGALTTVNASIAELYRAEYGVPAEVVRNAIARQPLRPTPVEEDRVRLVHSGIAAPERNIEAIIDAASQLGDRFTLDLYLMGDPSGYLGSLMRRASTAPNVNVHDPVPPSALPETLNAGDLGVYLLPVKTLNHELMLPNKFFDFVQARIGVVMSPARETSALIREHELGPELRGHSIGELVDVLNSLDADDIRTFKANAHIAAEMLNSDQDNATMRTILGRLAAS